MLSCQICIDENGDGASNSATFSSFDQLEAHLAADHFSLLPYECEHCQFAKFPTEFAMMKHNEFDHDSRSYTFRCRITPEVKEKRRKIKEFLSKVAEEEEAVPNKRFNGRQEKQFPSDASQQMGQKREAKGGQRKNGQNKVNDEEEEQEEKPKRMCLRPRPFSFYGKMETNIECSSERAVISLPIFSGEEDETTAEGSRLTNELKEQQADVQEILRATAVAVSQFGGPKNHFTPPAKQRPAQESYSLRPNRFKPYALLHHGIPILTEDDVLEQIARNSQEMENYQSPLKSGRKRGKSDAISQICCKKCKKMVNARDGCLSHHTNARHLRLPMFHCKRCKQDFFEVSNTRILKHINGQHEGETKYLVNNYHKFSAILRATRDECFGGKTERIHVIRNKVEKLNRKCKNKRSGKEEKSGNEIAKGKNNALTDIAKNNSQLLNVSNNGVNSKEEGSVGDTSNIQNVFHSKKANDAAMSPPFDKYSFLISCSGRNSAEFKRPKRNSQLQILPENGDNQRIQCKVCGEMVWNKTINRLNHVNVRHLQLPLHQCAVCDKSFTSYSRSACHSHVQFAHKAEIDSGKCSKVIEDHIIYRKEAYDEQLMEAVKEHF